MINFKYVRFQNFLSYGNSPTTIALDESPITFLSGKNGSGKSTFMDAICYGLYNKTFRDIAKPTVTNSVNGKQCLVEIAFDIGSTQYIVKRGIKPAIFEIYVNDALINQDAAARDYQKILEDQILKLNFKSFTQLVILGSASYVPFLKLSTPVRREIVEDLLDIKVFTGMRKTLKDLNDDTLKEKRELDTTISITVEKLKSISKYIDAIELDRSAVREGIQTEIDQLYIDNQSLDTNQLELIDRRTVLYADTSNLNEIQERKNKLVEYKKLYAFQIREEEKQSVFFGKNSACPTCTQEITESLRAEKQDINIKKISTLNEAIEKADNILQGYEEKNNIILNVLQEVRKLDTMINDIGQSKNQNFWKIDSLQQEIIKSNNSIDTKKETQELKTLAAAILKMHTKKDILNEQLYNYEVCSNLLKDTGIKSSIIKQYVPILNSLINHYLAELDFYVNFTLDENFNETIKARHRDIMGYNNFSEGERTRINLAILFAFRTISETKNTCNTNLLIIDELFSSSMDTDGTDAIVGLLRDMPDRNIFIISHTISDVPENWKHFEVTKEGNFSIIEEKVY